MRWLVSYRTAEGESRKSEIEADNRAAIIPMMRERGCMVLNIEEVIVNKEKKHSSVSIGKVFFIFLIALIIIGALYYITEKHFAEDKKEIRLKVRDSFKPNSGVQIKFVE